MSPLWRRAAVLILTPPVFGRLFSLMRLITFPLLLLVAGVFVTCTGDENARDQQQQRERGEPHEGEETPKNGRGQYQDSGATPKRTHLRRGAPAPPPLWYAPPLPPPH